MHEPIEIEQPVSGPPTGSGSPAHVSGSPWTWLYEFRPPSVGESTACAACGEASAQVLQVACGLRKEVDWLRWLDDPALSRDAEGHAAALFLALSAVLESGSDFAAYGPLTDRVAARLACPDLSPIAQAGLRLQLAAAELVGPGRLAVAAQQLAHVGQAAKAAKSAAIGIFLASLRASAELMAGRLSVADAIVRDALFIDPEPTSHRIAKVYLHATQDLLNAVRGRTEHATCPAPPDMGAAAFDDLPNSLWLISMGHRLLSMAVRGDDEPAVRAVADRLRERSIPDHKHYYRSYTHFALGAEALLAGRADAAWFHAETAIELGQRCHSAVATRTSTLLAIQALADLDRHDEAQALIDRTRAPWVAQGAALLVAVAQLERAEMCLYGGEVDRARDALRAARAVLPAGEDLPCHMRRPQRIAGLVQRIEPQTAIGPIAPHDGRPVQISTFGRLKVEVKGRTLFDRDWHGSRAKTLLTALIALGGHKVSADRLCDVLWPDADGDNARNNLKVALWRLRRIGCAADEKPLPWVVVKHGHVSIASSLCRVDCLEFERELEAAQRDGDTRRLQAVLLTVTAPFLCDNDSDDWVVRYRDSLQRHVAQAMRLLPGTQPDAPNGKDTARQHTDSTMRNRPSTADAVTGSGTRASNRS